MNTIKLVYAVRVHERMDGLYLFRSHRDARRFQDAVKQSGGDAEMTEEPINNVASTSELVEQELDEC